jgi:hypothetical protein
MAFGFVVARFDLFLGLMRVSNPDPGVTHQLTWISSTLGIALVVLGATEILGALYNHRLYIPSIRGYPAAGHAMAYLVSLGGACLYRHSLGGISGLRVILRSPLKRSPSRRLATNVFNHLSFLIHSEVADPAVRIHRKHIC